MKKIVFMFLLSFWICGCGSYVLEYDEEEVKKETLEYLKEKYGGHYEYNHSSSPGGSNFVQASFKDLDRSDEKGMIFIVVVWTDDNGAKSDYERYYEKKLEYNEDFVKKEAQEYLESKYGQKFEFKWCIAYTDYIGITFDVLDNTKQNTVIVEWREDGTMTDNYEE